MFPPRLPAGGSVGFSRRHRVACSVLGLSACLVLASTAAPVLIHRYSFNTAGVAEDSATGGTRGGAPELLHGTIVGAATVSGGSLRTNGETNGRAYVALPSGVTATLTGSFTIQHFATPDASSPSYSTLSAFTRLGDDNHDGSQANLLVSQPVRGQTGNPSAFGYRQAGVNGGNELLMTGASGDAGGTMHTFTTTFDAETGTARYYRDGVLANTTAVGALTGFNLSLLTHIGINGRAAWPDPSLKGSTQEFRIYRGALDQAQVTATVGNADLTPAQFEDAGIDVPGGAPALTDRTVVQSNRWHPSEILAWSSATDPLAPYNRSVVPLATRFTAPKATDNAALNALWNVNTHARPEEGRVQAITTFNTIPAGMPNGFRTTRLYAPSMWQYTDSMSFWGSSDRDNRVIMCPTAHTIDAAHRNGVRIYGKIFFYWNASSDPVSVRRVRDLIQKDGNRFPVADKLVEAAVYYGFDGWFFNQETFGTNSTDAQAVRDFMVYFRTRAAEVGAPHLKMEWYDAMAENGNRSFQNAFTNSNDGFMKSGTNVTDTGNTLAAHEMFLNFWWWGTNNPANSRALAITRGVNPYDLYAGIWTENYRKYGVTPDANSANEIQIDWSKLFPEGAPHNTSVGLFGGETPWFKSPTPAGGVTQDQIYWSGPNSDPTNTTPPAGSNTPNWFGLAHYIPANSPLTQLPFITNFNLGQGNFYKINGTTVMNGAWTNLGVQDILPTWRWIVTGSNGSKTVTPSIDFADSYYGGSALKVTGSLTANVTQDIKLYQTRLPMAADTSLKLVYKPAASNDAQIRVGFAFEDAPGTMVYSNPTSTSNTTGWTTLTVPMSAYAGRSLALITLRFSSASGVGSYTTTIGRIHISNGSVVNPQPPSALALEGKMFNPDEAFSTTLRLKWAASPSPVLYYNLYHRKDSSGGSPRVWLGATPNNYFVAQDVRRFGTEGSGFIEVEAVGPDHGVSTPATTPSATFEFEPYPNLHRPLITSYPVAAPLAVIGSNADLANKTRAFDNNTTNYTEAAAANDGWVGIDLGAGNAARVTAVQFFPRTGESGRMLYGTFQGSNTADFTSGVVQLAKIETRPPQGVYTTLMVTNPGTFRYLRYLSPGDGWANVAEVKFYGDGAALSPQPPLSLQATVSGTTASLNWLPATAGMTNGYTVLRSTVNGGAYTPIVTGLNATSWQDTGLAAGGRYYYTVVAENELGTSTASGRLIVSPLASTKLNGSVIGTGGSWNNGPDVQTNVFDGNLNTFWDAPVSDGAWVGLNLGSPRKITAIRYSPRNSADNWPARMVGGIFQAADNPSFTNPVTLFTVPSSPVRNVYTIASVIDVPMYQYVRYLSPAGGHCNVSEVEIYGVSLPAAPPSLFVTPQGANAQLGWTGVSTAFKYRVKRSTVSGGPYAPLAEATSTSHQDQNLDPYTTFYYVVSAVNEAGEGPPSPQAIRHDAYNAWLIASGGTPQGAGSGFGETLPGSDLPNGVRYMIPGGMQAAADETARQITGIVRNDPAVTVTLWRSADLTDWTEVPVADSPDQSGVEPGYRRVGATIEGPFDGTPALYRFKFTR